VKKEKGGRKDPDLKLKIEPFKIKQPPLRKEVKRRTRVVGRFPNETSALVMVFKLFGGREDKVEEGHDKS